MKTYVGQVTQWLPSHPVLRYSRILPSSIHLHFFRQFTSFYILSLSLYLVSETATPTRQKQNNKHRCIPINNIFFFQVSFFLDYYILTSCIYFILIRNIKRTRLQKIQHWRWILAKLSGRGISERKDKWVKSRKAASTERTNESFCFPLFVSQEEGFS